MPTRSLALSSSVSLALAAGSVLAAPAPTAEPGAESGVLVFSVRDADGVGLPARLTFIAEDGSRPELFGNAGADAGDLAVRPSVLYSLSGSNEITVPVGRYTVWVSRGMEYGISRHEIEVVAGSTASLDAVLHNEIDTTGWISGDYHLHTLTHSGHGDSSLPERVISIAGEGLEFAVATDHNHNTDYRPTMEALGAKDAFRAVPGNEVSTPVGHFNAFPLDPGAGVIHYRVPSAVPLFKMIRAERNAWGVTPVVQVNHPRWGDINYFGQASLDPVTGTSTSEVWSADFDTIEVFNENEGWGYYDPDETDLYVGSQSHSVLRDWFNLLNRGARYAAVGNSDSHDVASELAGIPRNYTPSPTDTAREIDPAEVARMLRGNRVFTTTGPFVEFSVNGTPMGGTVRADRALGGGPAEIAVRVRVQAASWIDVDRVKVVVNGDVARVIAIPESQAAVRLDETVFLSTPSANDAWVSLLVEGDEPMAPVMHDQGRPLLPLAVTNPVWVDADGEAGWTSPIENARVEADRFSKVTRFLESGLSAYMGSVTPSERALLIQAAAEAGHAFTPRAVARGLVDEDRSVRLAAARAAQTIADSSLMPALDRAAQESADDGLLSLRLMFARAACSGGNMTRDVIELLTQEGSAVVSRYRHELLGLVRGRFITRWMFAGYFDCPEPGLVLTRRFGPERGASMDAVFETRDGERGWTPIEASDSGLIDLRAAGETSCANAVSYVQAWVISPDAREATFTLGSDDSAVAWVNGEKVYEEIAARGADPMQFIGTMRLNPGANRVLLKVQNGGGEHGAYFRVLDEDVGFSRMKP